MKYRFFIIIGIIFGIASAMPLCAQITCVTKAPAQIAVGQAFNITYDLNDRPEKLPSINFPNFRLAGGPSVGSSSYTSYANGQVQSSQSFTYTYAFVAEKEGNYTIPSVIFIVKNQQVKSNPVNIVVTAGAQNQQSNANRQTTETQGFNKNDYYVKAFVSNSNPYVGEQAIVTYKLYLGPQTYQCQPQITSRPTTQGFWTYDLSSKDGQATQKEEIIDGKKFIVIDMYSLAVYPQKSGKQTISPLETNLIVQIPVQQQRRSNDIFDLFSDPFFGGTRLQNVELNLSSNAVTIQAKELPIASKPLLFSGLVGDFKLSAKLSRDKLAANDATNLTVTISGAGNLQYIEPLDFEFPTDIAVHDPEIRDNISTLPSGVSGSRTFEYVLIPRVEGNYTISPASFSFFDKRKGSYTTLYTPEFTINVGKGQASNAVAFDANTKTDVKILGTDIHHIKTNWKPELYTASFFLSPLYWLLLILPIVLLILFMIVFRKRMESRKNTVLLRDKKASKTARKRLRKAEKCLQNNQNEVFYIEISKVLWGYISDKFHIPVGQLSLDTAEQKLSERNMQEDSIKEFISTLNDCEYVRFAPSPDITPEKMYERTFNFITKIERELKR
jgi:hypothetical protein